MAKDPAYRRCCRRGKKHAADAPEGAFRETWQSGMLICRSNLLEKAERINKSSQEEKDGEARTSGNEKAKNRKLKK